jgi:autotransporter passenger strand-loop-strand repeat protein
VSYVPAYQYVESGGNAVSVTIGGGGTEQIYAGGSAGNIVVSSGGTLDVYSGATASGVIVLSGGSLVDSGTVLGLTVSSGGIETIATTVASGQTVSGALISSGTQTVLSGGATVSTTIGADGNVFISSGANAGSTVINDGAEFVFGGTVNSLTISSGGENYDQFGGTVSNIVISNGGADYVQYDGHVSNVIIDSGGFENVQSGGSAGNVTVGSGGTLDVLSGGSAINSLVLSGGIEIVSSGGIVSGTTLSGGGTIDLRGLVFSSGGMASLNSSTDVLTVTEGGVSSFVTLVGDYTGEFFNLANDGLFGTEVTAEGTPCYCRGTLILTDRGEVAVEDLRIGDLLVTPAGEMRPIRWIGRRSYSGRFAAGNRDVLPVRIAKDALAAGVPRRDLFVSPLHAMFLDGVLIPAFALVNGASITQAASVDQVEYFHLELETHDVIIAEGAASESFLDDDSRGMFHNAADYRRLYPTAPRVSPRYCAPVVEDGEILAAVRTRIADRLGKRDKHRAGKALTG